MKTESHLGKATVKCQTQNQEILRDIKFSLKGMCRPTGFDTRGLGSKTRQISPQYRVWALAIHVLHLWYQLYGKFILLTPSSD